MIAKELISEAVFSVKPTDTLGLAVDRMRENCIGQLPVVQDNQFLGLLYDEEAATSVEKDALVSSVEYSNELLFVYEGQHIYDVIRLFYVHQLDILPVLTMKYFYVGVITLRRVVDHMAILMDSDHVGGIIVLEVNNRDNSLSHIAQIVESDNAQIMSSYVRSFSESTKMEITLKLNRTDISSIIAAFLRYDYMVKATFNDAKVHDSLKDRYDQLMNYLDM